MRGPSPGRLQVSHFWLTYGDADRFLGVAIMEAPSLLEARMSAATRRIASGVPFAEGHQLSPKLIALIPPTKIGRMLSRIEAIQLIRDLEDHMRR
jgi:hypothetical protein